MTVFSGSLNRKFLSGTAIGLIAVSVVFLALFVAMYRSQLTEERGHASVEINHLLQASLENAMLKRDLEGLREIVNRLGGQAGIVGVMVLNPEGEVRFSSRPEKLGVRFFQDRDVPTDGETIFLVDDQQQEVLRSLNPVPNRAPCVKCHGDVAENPINGILLVDYSAEPIRRHAFNTTLMLMGAGAIVVLICLAGGWWFMRRFVLTPVQALATATRSISAGSLDARVDVASESDEFAELAVTFNDMARNLRQSFRSIEEKERFIQALMDSDPDGIRVINDRFEIVKANRTYCEQLGVEAGDIAGVHCYRSSHGRTEPCPPTLTTCPLHELRNKDKPIKVRHRHVRRDGTPLWVEVYAAPLVVEVDGEAQFLIVESIRNLSEAVKYSHEQKLSTVGQLAAGVAHEVHNPLASVRMALQSALRSIKEEQHDVDRLRSYLELLDRKVDECVEVTGRLMKLSAFPSQSPTLIDINPAIKETASLLRYEAARLGVEVQLNLDDPSPRIIAVDGELRMVVLNMMQNAFHAMPRGGKLIISCHQFENKVELTFTDNGKGISADALPNIFDPFFSDRADRINGTGLGLTISKSIVERFDGTIEVDSVPGQGTHFTMRFKTADAAH